MKLKIGLAQISPVLADPAANLKKHLDYIRRAAGEGAHLIVFPELSLTGYMLQGLTPSVAARSVDDPVLRPLAEASKDIDIVMSFVEEDRRHRSYISAAFLSGGEVAHLHRKVYLTTYGMFEEGRFFSPGEEVRAFDTRWGRAGILICEDYWHMSMPYILWQDGADLLFCIAAQPASGVAGGDELFESNRTKSGVLRTYARFLTDFVIHCNRVGFEEGVGFSGDSFVAGPDGLLRARAGQFEEELVVVDIDMDDLRRQRLVSPLLRDEKLGLAIRELMRIDSRRGEHLR